MIACQDLDKNDEEKEKYEAVADMEKVPVGERPFLEASCFKRRKCEETYEYLQLALDDDEFKEAFPKSKLGYIGTFKCATTSAPKRENPFGPTETVYHVPYVPNTQYRVRRLVMGTGLSEDTNYLTPSKHVYEDQAEDVLAWGLDDIKKETE